MMYGQEQGPLGSPDGTTGVPLKARCASTLTFGGHASLICHSCFSYPPLLPPISDKCSVAQFRFSSAVKSPLVSPAAEVSPLTCHLATHVTRTSLTRLSPSFSLSCSHPQGAAAQLLVSRYATPLAEHHDESHLTKFELLLEASLDLEAVPQEYLISAAYDSRLQVGKCDGGRVADVLVRVQAQWQAGRQAGKAGRGAAHPHTACALAHAGLSRAGCAGVVCLLSCLLPHACSGPSHCSFAPGRGPLLTALRNTHPPTLQSIHLSEQTIQPCV